MNLAEMEVAKLDALASEYRRQGYEVLVHPDRALVPDFLIGFVPDLIAERPDDKVVVQIQTAQSFDSERVQQVAEFVRGQHPWRYEVALVNLPTAPDVPADVELAPEERINDLISTAELLAAQRQVEAAALIAWSAVEAILRRRARSAAPEIERQSSARVLKHLYSLGEIPSDMYEKLSRLLEFRNAVAHGFAPRQNAPSVSNLIDDIRRLQRAA